MMPDGNEQGFIRTRQQDHPRPCTDYGFVRRVCNDKLKIPFSFEKLEPTVFPANGTIILYFSLIFPYEDFREIDSNWQWLMEVQF